MGTTRFRNDVVFTDSVDMSAATVTMPTAIEATDNVTWSGDHTFEGAVDLSTATLTLAAGEIDSADVANGAIDPVHLSSGHRELAADAALTLAATDRSVELNITTGTTVATMTATHTGHEVTVYAGIRSGGAYTLGCTRGATAGDVTLDAVGEGCIVKYNGSAWKLVALLGGATFA